MHQGTNRGRVTQRVRFGRLNVLYDEEGYEYPIDDEDHIYVPLESEQTVSESVTEENIENKQKNKKIYFKCVLCWCHNLLS